MSSCRQVEVQFEDPSPKKWCHPLKEDAFAALMGKDSPMVQKVFGEGSLFSPMLFGKFFDPSDAFPLWEFDPDALLSIVHGSSQRKVDWFQTDSHYVLKAEIPGPGNITLQVCVEKGKFVVEISGQWHPPSNHKTKNWKSINWWEYGYVRRLEIPENSDWGKLEANLINDMLLEIRIPKIPLDSEMKLGGEE